MEDLYIETPVVMKAVSRLPPDVLEARFVYFILFVNFQLKFWDRNRRIARAFDLSFKRKELPVELQVGDPMELYLEKYIKEIEEEELERAHLTPF